jgi:hypothetical protein
MTKAEVFEHLQICCIIIPVETTQVLPNCRHVSPMGYSKLTESKWHSSSGIEQRSIQDTTVLVMPQKP